MNTHIDFLKELQLQISSIDLANDQAFTIVFRNAIDLLGKSDQWVADELYVSRPTISRWRREKNLPHRGLRGPILIWVSKEVSERISLLCRL